MNEHHWSDSKTRGGISRVSRYFFQRKLLCIKNSYFCTLKLLIQNFNVKVCLINFFAYDKIA